MNSRSRAILILAVFFIICPAVAADGYIAVWSYPDDAYVYVYQDTWVYIGNTKDYDWLTWQLTEGFYKIKNN
jgi:hypothetical protein